MTEISKVQNKWKFLGLTWALVFIFGWLPIVLPSFSIVILKGLILFSITFSILIVFFWPKLEWYILVPLSQIFPIEFLILSIRSMSFLPPFLTYVFSGIIILCYIGMFFLPKFTPRISYLAVYGNPESKLEKQIYRFVLGTLGIAGACGASIGMFGGRLYGWKILGPIGPVIGLVAIFFGHLTFYNLWQKRPWITLENRGKS